MKNGKLNGKIAVVTGASKGIGADIAKQFGAEGAAVVVNYASDKQGADRVVDSITKRGGKAVAVQANVAKRSEVERLFAAAAKAFGKTDVLVNNAGVYEFMPLEEVTEQQFHRMFDTNVLGMLLVTQEALKHFNPDGGSIINIGSLASVLTPPTAVVYNATKGAVDAITRTLAKELGPRKIRVNSINPGMVVTEGVVAGGFTESDFRKTIEIADAARSDRTNGRHCARCGVLCVRRFGVDYRRNTVNRWRSSLGYLPLQHFDYERFNDRRSHYERKCE
jgi:3-oxoacyl-[acyl-carrier protein] reductase